MLTNNWQKLNIDFILISLSFLIFPLSISLSLSAIALFFLKRITNFQALYRSPTFYTAILYTSLTYLAFAFYFDQGFEEFINNHLYPVTNHDYLIVIISFVTLKCFPIHIETLKKSLYIFNLTPLVVFLVNFQHFRLSSRSSMGFENPNWLGLYTAICIPIIILSLTQNFSNYPLKCKLLKLVFFISLIIAVLMLLASASRSSFLITLFNLLILMFHSFKKKAFFSIKQGSLLLVSLGFLGFLTHYILPSADVTVFSRLTNIWDNNIQKRVEIYTCFLSLGEDKPFFGWSPENTAKICENLLNWPLGSVNHAHNFILQIFADYGCFITLLVLYFLLDTLLIPLYKQLKNNSLSESRDFPIYQALSLSSLTIILINLFQSGFYHYPLFPVWLGLFLGSQHNLLENISKS